MWLTISNKYYRKLDEQAAKQRQREKEAEEKLAARKAKPTAFERPTPRLAERPAPERAESSERGPPRLALAGNKPTWREREAMKAAGGAPAPPAAPPSDIATAEAELPKRFVPPALRGRAEGASGARDQSPSDATAKWRPSSQRRDAPRGESPADNAGPKFPSRSRMGDVTAPRDESPADGGAPKFAPRGLRADGPPRDESPAAPAPATGKYVPRFRRGQD